MGFFLLGKRRDNGALELINDSLYESRQDAIDALSKIDVPADLESEVFAVDLESATSMVVVQKKAAVEAVEDVAVADAIAAEEIAAEEALEADTEADSDSQPVDALEAPAEEFAEEADGAGLHHALKGAAASLEGEGIVAPESVGPAGESKAWPWDSEEAPADIEQVAEAELEEALADVAVEEEIVAEAAAAEAVVSEPEYIPDPLEEPAVSVGDMVATPDSEGDLDASRPVIMGAYGEAAPDEQDPEPVEAPPAADSDVVITAELPAEPEFQGSVVEPENVKARDDLESVLADLEITEPMGAEPTTEVEELPRIEVPAEMAEEIPAAPVVAEDAVLDSVLDPDSVAEEAPAAVGDLMAEAGLDAPADAGPGFAGGDSDLADLSCEDCVYMNTCPKQGESDPSSCGSFQWKSS